MIRGGWRRFRPRNVIERASEHTSPLDDPFDEAAAIIDRLLQLNRSIDRAIDTVEHRAALSPTAPQLIAQLVLMTPRAARAQQKLDAHSAGWYDKKARVMELVDFNDTFVATVLALPESRRHDFVPKIHAMMSDFCQRQRAKMFLDGQFSAIAHGLSREIAVYLAAQDEGFDVFMTSRSDDAFGVDMQIRDRSSGKYVNIDCKTHSSYFFRLRELTRQRRISSKDAVHAQDRGYVRIINRHENDRIPVILLRIDHTILGDIVDFRFTNRFKIVEILDQILNAYGQDDGRYGRIISGL